ncbi:MAG: hypothetical protein QXD51_03480 [Candidatus Anstonellales archaeon]
MKVLDRMSATLKAGFGMTLKKWKELLVGFGKVYGSVVAFFLVGFVVMILLAMLSEILILLGLILMIPVSIIAGGIALSSNTLVDNVADEKEFELIETIKKDWIRNSVFVIMMGLFWVALSIPGMIGEFVGGIAGLLLILIGWLIYLAWIFIVQFVQWEYVVGRKGIVESIKGSYSAVMKNFGFVLGMDIVVGMLMAIILAVFYITAIIIVTMFALAAVFGSTPSIGGGDVSDIFPLFGIWAVVGFFVSALLAIGISITIDVLFKPVSYFTWKEATKNK